MTSIKTQLSVFLDNRPGTLARACQSLAANGVNILAMCISDTLDHAVIRLVVDDAKKAVAILNNLKLPLQERDVVLIDLPNQPGAIAAIAQKLAQAGINLEYAYCASTPSQTSGALVLRTNNLEETIDVLE